MRHIFFASALTLILPALAFSAHGATPTAASDTQSVSGVCKPQNTYVTKGGLKAAPSDQRTLFACDNVVVTFLDAKRQHIALEFGLKGGKKDSKVIGFDGIMEPVDGGLATAKIKQMYLVRGVMNPTDDGDCYLAFTGRAVTEAQCSGSMHKGKDRWEAVISFKAAPGR